VSYSGARATTVSLLNSSRLMQCWNGSVADMCEHCFDETISDCPETDGLDHLQWLAMPDNLISMGLHFVIGKCTQRPTNFIAVRIDEYYLLIFQYTPTPCVTYVYLHFQNVRICLKLFGKHQVEHEREDPELQIKKMARPLYPCLWAGN